MLVLCTICSTVYGGDDTWDGTFLASNDMISGRLMLDRGGRVRVGPDISWLDGLADEETEGWRFAIAARYDLIQEQAFKAWFLEAPATWYIGGLGGVLLPVEGVNEGDVDATAALMTGFEMGDEKAKLGAEYQYLLTDNLWSQLADIPDDHRLLFTATFKF